MGWTCTRMYEWAATTMSPSARWGLHSLVCIAPAAQARASAGASGAGWSGQNASCTLPAQRAASGNARQRWARWPKACTARASARRSDRASTAHIVLPASGCCSCRLADLRNLLCLPRGQSARRRRGRHGAGVDCAKLQEGLHKRHRQLQRLCNQHREPALARGQHVLHTRAKPVKPERRRDLHRLQSCGGRPGGRAGGQAGGRHLCGDGR